MTITTPEIDAALGSIIKLHRNSAGVSQITLGRSAGISFQQIQKYEAGTNRLSVSRLFQICKSLELEPADVIRDLQNVVVPPRGKQNTAANPQLEFLATKSGQRVIAVMMALKRPELIEACANLLTAVHKDELPDDIAAQ